MLCQLSYWPSLRSLIAKLLIADCQLLNAIGHRCRIRFCNCAFCHFTSVYFCSLCAVCFLQNRQYLLSSIRSVVFFLFLLVL